MSFDNTIELAEKYTTLLDEKYKVESRTGILDAQDELVRDSMDAKTIFTPRIDTSGLGDYDRNSGFNRGKVDVNWEAHTFTQDRGTQFQIDEADNLETLEVAFGRASGEFIRVEVAPEIDAYRFSTMANKAENSEDENLSASTVVQAIDIAHEEMDNAEVPDDGRIIFCNPTVWRLLKQSDLLERYVDVESGQEMVNRNIRSLDGRPIVKVPQSRFNTAILQKDVDENNDGGFEAAGNPINFMIVHDGAVLPITKLDGLRIFDPATNQQARGWLFDYRVYHDIFVPNNKTEGIYVHTAELFDVTFEVDDGSSNDIEGANVTVNGVFVKETDEDGNTEAFELADGTYSYVVEKDGDEVEGEFTVDGADKTVTVSDATFA